MSGGGGVIPTRGRQNSQPLQSFKKPDFTLFSLQKDPLFGASLQQWSAVKFDRRFQRGLVSGG